MIRTNPLKLDPTRSITLRRSFSQALVASFAKLRRDIVQLIVVEDAFGLRQDIAILGLNKDYASTQFNITDREVLRTVLYLQDNIDPSDLIKVDTNIHITIRYGLIEQDSTEEAIQTLIRDYGPVIVTLGQLSIFEMPDRDVLKFDVESGQLRELNERLKLLPNYEEFKYHPHMTVAYLKKGIGQKYVRQTSVTGKQLTFTKVVYSDTERNHTELSLNKRWKYETQSEAVSKFDEWLDAKINSTLLSTSEANKWKKFVQKGFNKGAARAFTDSASNKKQSVKDAMRSQGYLEGSREQFLRLILGKAITVEKLKLLDERALSEVKGMADDLKAKAKRALTDGLVKGQSPTQLAGNLSKVLQISKGRAQTIANTELVRAHAEGQLEAMEQLGITSVGIAVEWSTASNPCKVCQPLKGIVLSLPEARGMLPRHPNCRCAWLPAGIGESDTERKAQKRGKYKIDKAIEQSQKRGDDSDEWGPAKDITRKRPTINVECVCSDGLTAFAKLLEQVHNAAKLSGGDWRTIYGQHVYIKDGKIIAGGSAELRESVNSGKHKGNEDDHKSASSKKDGHWVNMGKGLDLRLEGGKVVEGPKQYHGMSVLEVSKHIAKERKEAKIHDDLDNPSHDTKSKKDEPKVPKKEDTKLADDKTHKPVTQSDKDKHLALFGSDTEIRKTDRSQESVNRISKINKISKDVLKTDTDKQAVLDYTDPKKALFESLNKKQREGRSKELTVDEKRISDILDKITNTTIPETPTYRGIQIDKSKIGEVIDQYKNAAKTGEEVTFQSHTSTSPKAGQAHIFAVAPQSADDLKNSGQKQGLMFEIVATKGFYVPKEHSHKKEESELILPKGAKYKVVGVSTTDYGFFNGRENKHVTVKLIQIHDDHTNNMVLNVLTPLNEEDVVEVDRDSKVFKELMEVNK